MTRRYDDEFEVFGRDDIYGREGADSNVDSPGGYPLQKYHGHYVMNLTAAEKADELKSEHSALCSDKFLNFLNSINVLKS